MLKNWRCRVVGTAGGGGGRRHQEEKIQGFRGRFEGNTGMGPSTQKGRDESSDLSHQLGIDDEKLEYQFLSWHFGFSAICASVEIPLTFL